MPSVLFRTFKNHVTNEDVSFPYYPECPFAKCQLALAKKKDDRMVVMCTHPNKVKNWTMCLTHHICDEGTKLTACPYGTEDSP